MTSGARCLGRGVASSRLSSVAVGGWTMVVTSCENTAYTTERKYKCNTSINIQQIDRELVSGMNVVFKVDI